MRGDDLKKFIELAERRTNASIKQIRLIGNLSNKTNYSYEKHHVDAIFKRLNTELSDAKKKFDIAYGNAADDTFKLGE